MEIRKYRFFLFLSMVYGSAFAQQSAVIQGIVSDQKGAPLELANIYLRGSVTGTVSDASGWFSFAIGPAGNYDLVVSVLGFEPYEKQIDIHPGDTLQFEIILREKLLELEEATVTASSFSTGNLEVATLTPVEVVTTPGAAADIFRAFQSFPGVASVTEGSGLFVRGGDVSETKILLDQATVVHPYKYETPTGGVFGTIPPFLVSGTFFSTGGFPARYGNALSGVLSMDSQGLPDNSTGDLNIGLAAASAGTSLEIIPKKLGVSLSGNQSFTETMFRVNGLQDEFTEAPSSTDLNANVILKPRPSSTIKLFSYFTKNNVGVNVAEPSFQGSFAENEVNHLHNLQWTEMPGAWLMKTSLSVNRFISDSDLGVLDLTERDITYKLRTDWEHRISDKIRIYTGAEAVRQQNEFEGRVPADDYVLNPSADFSQINEHYAINRAGVYAETDLKLSYRWLLNTGIRSDFHQTSGKLTIDPRLAVSYQLNRHSSLRASAGIYHQFPEPFDLNPETGNPDLLPLKAVHYILGFENETDLLHFRAEGYLKQYDDLVIPDEELNFSNHGCGYARGLDIFLRYSRFLQSRFNGWISYSFLQSERYQARSVRNGYLFETAPSGFDITHNLNLVGKFRVISTFYLGMSYRFATGKPYTPVADSWQPEDQPYFIPVEGAVHSGRLPDFHRMDMNLSYYLPLADNQAVTFYVSVSNALNRDNVTGYTYSNDYSTKTLVYSNYKRFIYAGVTATFNL